MYSDHPGLSMASILREHGYDVKELASNKNDDNRLHQAAWSESEFSLCADIY